MLDRKISWNFSGKVRAASCFAVFAVTGIAATAFANAEPGAFLNTHVSSVQGLVHEVKADAAVRDRFERHFGQSEQQLEEWFATFHVATISETGDYDVYNCHEDGVIRKRTLKLKKGTKVFEDPAGTPILEMSCGNPLYAGTDQEGDVGDFPVTFMPIQQDQIASLVTPDEQPVYSAVVPATEPTYEAVVVNPLPPPTQPPVVNPAPPPAPAPAGANFPIPVLGGLLIPFFGHHSSPPPAPPVPEPSSMAGLTLGVLAVGMTALKKKRA